MAEVKKNKKIAGKGKLDVATELRRLGVVIENVDGKVDLLAEQYLDINKKLDSHTEIIGRLAVDMEIVKTDLSIMKKDQEIMKKDQGIMKKDQEIMKSDIEFIKHGLKRKVDIDEFSALERRVAALEKRR